MPACCHCAKSDEESTLLKCPMCHRHSCDDCGYRRAGKFFCQMGCADEFFFADSEDDEESDHA